MEEVLLGNIQGVLVNNSRAGGHVLQGFPEGF